MRTNSKPITDDGNTIKIDIDGKQFDQQMVLHPISLILKKSSFTVITGPSGIGKTTLLKLIAGIDTQDSHSPTPYTIGFAFQEPRLLPWLTVQENLRLVAKNKNNISTLLEEMGLAEAANLFPAQISLGMARRISLARAFSVNPELLILDEPFVSLDEATADRLREWLLDYWGCKQPTVLMVTHDLREALQLADNIIVINGEPARIKNHYFYQDPRHTRDQTWIEQQLRILEKCLL